MNGKIAVNGTELNTRVDGPEGAEWIVLSNSLGADLTMWDPQIAFLTRKYRVLRYDTRGHGLSNAPPGPYHFDDLVGDITGLMDHFGIVRSTFMGLSLGGMSGLGLALSHPGRLKKLICCDARADAPAPFVESWDQRSAAIRKGGMEAVVSGSLERWLTEGFRSADPVATERCAEMIRNTQADGYIACAAALKRLDYLKDLHKLDLPVLYVVGDKDSGAPPQVMKEMAGQTRDSEFKMVLNAAHIANLDNASGFNAAIAGFLDLA